MFKNKQLILSMSDLEYFQYHSFKGLVYDKNKMSIDNGNTWLQSVQALCENPFNMDVLRMEQTRIDNKFFVIRFFYYLFNIGNYTINGSILAAVDALMAYRPEIHKRTPCYETVASNEPISLSNQWASEQFIKLFNSNNISCEEVTGESAIDAVEEAFDLQGECLSYNRSSSLRQSSVHARFSLSRAPSPEGLSIETSPPVRPPEDLNIDHLSRVVIDKQNEQLMKHLDSLGIFKTEGEISLSEIKRAFRDEIQKYHPQGTLRQGRLEEDEQKQENEERCRALTAASNYFFRSASSPREAGKGAAEEDSIDQLIIQCKGQTTQATLELLSFIQSVRHMSDEEISQNLGLECSLDEVSAYLALRREVQDKGDVKWLLDQGCSDEDLQDYLRSKKGSQQSTALVGEEGEQQLLEL